MEPIRVAASRSQAEEWALVLSAAGIPHAVERDPGGFMLLAPPEQAAFARGALAAYDAETRAAAPVTPAPAGPYPWMSGVVAGLIVLWMFSLTGTPAPASRWFERGAADAGHLLGGEPWRAVTALTLHVDVVHAAGNALALAVLLPPLVQRFGMGVALWLLLLAGAAGNALAAVAYAGSHLAVGASTAAFGAVGALAALRVIPGEPGASRRRWMAPVAGLVLLATLGGGARADVVAHALGLVAGGVLGLLAGVCVRRRALAPMQWSAGVAALMAVAGCWRLALRA
jgi:membrane associated rhomboid family serine protease